MKRKKSIEDFLIKQISEFMYMEVDEIETDELFSNFGLESITLAKIVSNICNEFDVNFEVKDILEYQTVDEASTFIYEKLAANVH